MIVGRAGRIAGVISMWDCCRFLDRALKVLAVVGLAALVSPAAADPAGCTAPLKPMLRVQLFFGRNIGDRFGAVTERQWQIFVDRELTSRFPGGITVLEAMGYAADSDSLIQEPSKVVIIVTKDEPAADERIAAVRRAYVAQFKQKSVGVVTQSICAAF